MIRITSGDAHCPSCGYRFSEAELLVLELVDELSFNPWLLYEPSLQSKINRLRSILGVPE